MTSQKHVLDDDIIELTNIIEEGILPLPVVNKHHVNAHQTPHNDAHTPSKAKALHNPVEQILAQTQPKKEAPESAEYAPLHDSTLSDAQKIPTSSNVSLQEKEANTDAMEASAKRPEAPKRLETQVLQSPKALRTDSSVLIRELQEHMALLHEENLMQRTLLEEEQAVFHSNSAQQATSKAHPDAYSNTHSDVSQPNQQAEQLHHQNGVPPQQVTDSHKQASGGQQGGASVASTVMTPSAFQRHNDAGIPTQISQPQRFALHTPAPQDVASEAAQNQQNASANEIATPHKQPLSASGNDTTQAPSSPRGTSESLSSNAPQDTKNSANTQPSHNPNSITTEEQKPSLAGQVFAPPQQGALQESRSAASRQEYAPTSNGESLSHHKKESAANEEGYPRTQANVESIAEKTLQGNTRISLRTEHASAEISMLKAYIRGQQESIARLEQRIAQLERQAHAKNTTAISPISEDVIEAIKQRITRSIRQTMNQAAAAAAAQALREEIALISKGLED